jgi:hypothetical protein
MKVTMESNFPIEDYLIEDLYCVDITMYTTDSCHNMIKWLNEHVGIESTDWGWITNNRFYFVKESDAVLFSLTWK